MGAPQAARDTAAVPAQGQPDTAVVSLSDIVVEADRIPLAVWEVPAAVTVRALGPDRALRYRTPADLAASLPGLRAYPSGNPWGQAVVDVRGFYGGGLAQYLLVSLDGIPLNDISTGLAPLTDLGLEAIGRVEATRGPVSAQYGDFAMGGLLGFSTAERGHHRIGLALTGSADDALGAVVTIQRPAGPCDVLASGGVRRSHGWRAHSRFVQETGLVRVMSTAARAARLCGMLSFSHTEEQQPGAVTEAQLATDRAGAARDAYGNPLEDDAESRCFTAGFSGTGTLGRRGQWHGSSWLRVTDADKIVTTTQAMDYRPRVISAGGEGAVEMQATAAGRPWRTSLGVSLDCGRLDSEYRERQSKNVIVGGSGWRAAVAAFARTRLELMPRLAVTGGLRADHAATEFEYEATNLTALSTTQSQSWFRLSPSVAVSVAAGRGVQCYGMVSGAFKSPTLNHLYGSAPFNAGPPTNSFILLSNSNLEPMTGTAWEIGTKFRNRRGGYGTVSIYHYRLREEIDFDQGAMCYINVGRSHHTGVEIAGGGPVRPDLTVEFSGIYTRAVIRSGEHADHRLAGVPEWSYRAEAVYAVAPGLAAGVLISGRIDQWLDAANTRRLSDHAEVAVMCGYGWRAFRLDVRIDNLFDERYEYDGYFDPLLAQVGQQPYRYYPAAPRQATVSLRVEL